MTQVLDTDTRFLAIGSVLSERSLALHATCLRAFGKGLLIIGPSGSGKSDLALQLMAYGAQLVADDQTILAAQHDQIIASCPEHTLGMIEARYMGLLKVAMAPRTPVWTVIDMGTIETARLPEPQTINLLGNAVRLYHKPANGAFAAAILQYLRAGDIPT